MEEFFDGLDCKLRVSGMVADSIMIGIVNSAMEQAFDKVCSKEGVIERLNEKSRFCELAVMQLEWCLKFVQEETESFLVESSCEREKLVSDLTETRDRIQRRLRETEVAISERDRELVEGMENDLKLRQALETKDRELSSLRANLELERTKIEGVMEFIPGTWVSGDEGRDGDFCELKNSVDQQFWNIKQKLEDERINLTNGMRKMSQGPCSSAHLGTDSEVVEERVCSDGKENGFYENDIVDEFRPQNCSLRPELNIGFEQMGSDIDILKGTLDLAFGMMDNAISLSEVGPMEQQWRWSIEKDITSVVLRGFLNDLQEKDLQVNLSVKVREGSRQIPMGEFSREDWSKLINDISNLRHELELSLNEVQPKSFKGCESASHIDVGSEVSSQKRKPKCSPEGEHGLECHGYGNSDNPSRKKEDPPAEDQSGSQNLVAKMIKNHESIIRRKSEELNWLKAEIQEEKECSCSRQENEPESPWKRIHNIILRLDNVFKRNSKLSATSDDYQSVQERDKMFPQISLSKSDLAGKEEIIHPFSKVPVKAGNVPVCSSINEDLSNEIRRLKEEREDENFLAMVMEETYLILFKGFVKEFHLLFHNYCTESLVREDICTIILREMVKEWSSEIESRRIESEQRDLIAFNEAVTGCGCSKDFAPNKYQNAGDEGNFQEDSSSAKLFQDIESVIRGDIYLVFLQEMVREWNMTIESYNIKNLVREEIDRIDFKETIKHGIIQKFKGVISEDAYKFVLQEMFKEWDMAIGNHNTKGLFNEGIYQIVSIEAIKDIEMVSKTRNRDIPSEDLPSTGTWFQGFESIMREDVCTVVFREMVNEWNMEIETYHIESLIREEVYLVVISEAIKDVNTLLKESEEVRKPDNFLDYSSSAGGLLNSPEVIEKENLIKKLDSLSRCLEVEEILMLTASSEIMEQSVHTDIVGLENEQLDNHDIHFEDMSTEKDDIFESVNEKLEKALHQLIVSKELLRELGCSLGIAVGYLEVSDEVTPTDGTLQNTENRDHSLCLPKDNKEEKMNTLASTITPLVEFPQLLVKFEHMVYEKMGVHILRLREAKQQLDPLVEYVASLKRKELLYRKAFIRRCNDLQKAEAEVDLLADEVDVLLGLLEKIYITLDQYSPILQHYFGVKDLLRLIKKELGGPAACASHQ